MMPDATQACAEGADAILSGGPGTPDRADVPPAERRKRRRLRIGQSLGLFATMRLVRMQPVPAGASP